MVGRISTIVTTGNSCTVALFVDLLLLLLQHVGEELYHVTHPVHVQAPSLLLPPVTHHHMLLGFVFCLAILTAQLFFVHILKIHFHSLHHLCPDSICRSSFPIAFSFIYSCSFVKSSFLMEVSLSHIPISTFISLLVFIKYSIPNLGQVIQSNFLADIILSSLPGKD